MTTDALSSRHPPSRRALSIVVAPLVAMVVASNIAYFVWPSLVDTHPLVLLCLSAQNRYLALTSNQLDALPYYAVGFVRLVLPDPFFYVLGLWYGARAIDWMERRMPSVGTSLRYLEKGFAKARHVVVFVAPNNPVCVLAGAAAMPARVFVLLNVTGTVARLVLIRILGNIFQGPIDAVLGFVRDYRWYLIGASVLLMAISTLADRKGGELGALRHLQDDLAADEPEPTPDEGDS